MIFKKIVCFVALMLSSAAFSAECTQYETIHPLWPLTGSHLSTGKCTSCGTCHVPIGNAVWNGTPRICITCHNGDPRWNTVGRSAAHLPTGFIDCAGCHNTTAFNSFTGITQTMIHTTGASVTCNVCHSGLYTSYNARGKPNDHPKTVTKNGVAILVTSVQCSYCHSSTASSFDN